jgi:hypothetical protein
VTGTRDGPQLSRNGVLAVFVMFRANHAQTRSWLSAARSGSTLNLQQRMQSAQIAALRKGEGFQFEDEISGARRRINEARRATAAHKKSTTEKRTAVEANGRMGYD